MKNTNTVKKIPVSHHEPNGIGMDNKRIYKTMLQPDGQLLSAFVLVSNFSSI